MSLKLVTAGDVPDTFNVIIEISADSSPVKYEVDKETHTLQVDRFLTTSMLYPCNYGYIPHTLCDDGDPMDVLVITPHPVVPGAVIKCRPIGILDMTDEAGGDSKILAVPVSKLTQDYDAIKHYDDFPASLIAKIGHFFEHYKDMSPGKWVKLGGWKDAKAAKQAVIESVDLYRQEGS